MNYVFLVCPSFWSSAFSSLLAIVFLLLRTFRGKGFIGVCLPSVLWHCWLGGRKGIRPVKNEWWGTGMVICLERDADLHMAQLMPLPLTVSCFSKIQIGFTFLVPAHPGSPGKWAIKQVCVCLWFYRPYAICPCCQSFILFYFVFVLFYFNVSELLI